MKKQAVWIAMVAAVVAGILVDVNCTGTAIAFGSIALSAAMVAFVEWLG